MNKERFFINLDRSLKTDKIEHDADIILKHPGKNKIPESNFKDKFSEETIDRDQKMVIRLREKFLTQIEHLSQPEIEKIKAGEKFSETLEIIIAEEGERFGWIGANNLITRASDFDNIYNGVDAILEFPPEPKTGPDIITKKIALGVDASRNNDPYALRTKINRNADKLSNPSSKKLPEVKYFQSAFNPKERGRLRPVVPVVIGLDYNHLAELLSLSASLRVLSENESKPADTEFAAASASPKQTVTEKLRQHPAQIIFCREIEIQLNYYLELLADKSFPRADLYKKEIQALLKKIQLITENKKDIPRADYEEDKVFSTIKNIVAELTAAL